MGYTAFTKMQQNNREKFGENDAAAHHFLKYWGLTSLFHDIGYPFELSFEQIKSYFGDTIDVVPYVKIENIYE